MELLEKLDFVQILSIGISGFGFLLILLAFILIYKEQSRPEEPRKGILSTIWYFMGLNFLSVIIVGAFSLPIISKNGRIQTEKEGVEKALKEKSSELNVVQSAQEFDQLIDMVNPENFTAHQLTKVNNYVASLDTLVTQYAATDSVKADSLHSIKEIIQKQFTAFRSDTASTYTRRLSLEKINATNHRLTDFVKRKSAIIKQ